MNPLEFIRSIPSSVKSGWVRTFDFGGTSTRSEFAGFYIGNHLILYFLLRKALGYAMVGAEKLGLLSIIWVPVCSLRDDRISKCTLLVCNQKVSGHRKIILVPGFSGDSNHCRRNHQNRCCIWNELILFIGSLIALTSHVLAVCKQRLNLEY